MKQNLLKNLEPARGNDVFPCNDLKEEIIDVFFPKSVFDLTQNLSNVTSAFYGLMLKTIGEEIGYEKIDLHSKKLFYQLGKLKTIQALEMNPKLEKNTKSFAIVLISAIYNASPEYNFNIEKYTDENTIITLTGVDRYLRVLTELGIDNYVTFPTLLAFVEGIKDALNLNCKIEYNFEKLEKKNETRCVYNFKMI